MRHQVSHVYEHAEALAQLLGELDGMSSDISQYVAFLVDRQPLMATMLPDESALNN